MRTINASWLLCIQISSGNIHHLFPNLIVHIIFYRDLGNFPKYESLLSSPSPPRYRLRGLRRELFCYIHFLKWFQGDSDDQSGLRIIVINKFYHRCLLHLNGCRLAIHTSFSFPSLVQFDALYTVFTKSERECLSLG